MLGITVATVFTLASVLSVSAALYPIQPVASTVWSAGRSELVSWMDDNSSPLLRNMGPIDIHLYANDTRHVATLAKGVNPTSRSLSVWISPVLARDANNYHIRFICKNPPLMIYTADFSISSMSTSASDAQTPTPTATLFTPLLTLVLPDTTITSQLAPTTPRAVPSRPVTPITNQADPQDPPDSQNILTPSKQYSGAGGSIGRRVDMEKLKFRLVFILWPALIGITMAL